MVIVNSILYHVTKTTNLKQKPYPEEEEGEGEAEGEAEGEEDLQHFADIAGAEDLMNNGEFERVIGREIRCKNAVFCAAPP